MESRFRDSTILSHGRHAARLGAIASIGSSVPDELALELDKATEERQIAK
jgi:hypothetical protein